MRNNKGQFVKGQRPSPATEFKRGQHWRKAQAFRNKAWLEAEYIKKARSTGDIAKQFNVTPTAICFWLKKHGIPRRNTSQARAVKHWGAKGEANPQYGKRGSKHPNWKGGVAGWRQHVYSLSEGREFLRLVWARDRGRCRMCGNKGKCEVHHIDPVFRAPLLIMDINNALLLCRVCHNKVRGKELKWRKRLYAILRKEVTK